MAFTVKTIIASGIIVGGIAIGTVAFTGTDSLTSVGNFAKTFKDKIANLDMSLTSWKDAFGNLKSDAQTKIETANALLSEKNGMISTLQASIADLQEQVDSGTGDSETMTAEIERLNGELTKANQAVASLLAEVEGYSVEVAGMGDTVEVAPAYTLASVIDSGTPEAPVTPPVTPDEDAEEPTPEPEEEPAPPAGDAPVIDLDEWFTAIQQRDLIEMGIYVTDIGFHKHSNGTNEYIYIRTSPAYSANVLNSQQQNNFKINIVPAIHEKLGFPVDTKQIRIFSNTASIEALNSADGFLASRNPADTIKNVNW